LEREVERLREGVSSRDGRINELEKQRQTDRLKLHEMREKLDAAERNAVDSRANTELEQAQKKMLESRLRMLEDSVRTSKDFHASTRFRLSDSADQIPSTTFLNQNAEDYPLSPTQDIESTSGIVMSPIDRVSAALAARAAAETSKNALKQANQMRQTKFCDVNTAGITSYGDGIKNNKAGVSVSVSTALLDAQSLSAADPYYDNSDDDDDVGSPSNHPGKGHTAASVDQDRQSRSSLAQEADNSPQQEQHTQQRRRHTNSLRVDNNEPQSVEDSISKTQSFLQRRLAAQARMAALAQKQQPQAEGDDKDQDSDGDTNNVSQQSYLQAAISASMLAAAAFEKHSKSADQQQKKHGLRSTASTASDGGLAASAEHIYAEDEDDMETASMLSAPSLHPSDPLELQDDKACHTDGQYQQQQEQQQYLEYMTSLSGLGIDDKMDTGHGGKKKKPKKSKKGGDAAHSSEESKLSSSSSTGDFGSNDGSFLPKILLTSSGKVSTGKSAYAPSSSRK
jgi:hypothetical protein